MSLIPTSSDRQILNETLQKFNATMETFLADFNAFQKKKALELATTLENLSPESEHSPQTWRTIVDASIMLGVSPKDIAVVSGCSVSTVQRWQSGISSPTPSARQYIIHKGLIPLLRARAEGK